VDDQRVTDAGWAAPAAGDQPAAPRAPRHRVARDLAPAARPVAPRRSRVPEPLVALAADGLAVWVAAAANLRAPAVATAFGLVCLVALAATREPRLAPSVLEETPAIGTRVLVAAIVITPVALAVGHAGGLALQVLATLASVLALRAIGYAIIRAGRRRGRLRRSVHVIGSVHDTSRIVRLFEHHPELGVEVTAAHAAPPGARAGRRGAEWGVTYVAVAAPGREDTLLRALRRSVVAGACVYLVPYCAALLPSSPDVEVVRGVPFIRLRPNIRYHPAVYAKRLFDVVGAAGALVVLSPVLVAAAIGVKLSSRGPVLFRQERVGRDGVLFTMYKFRTFPVEHVDEKFSLELDECPLPFGRLLRRTSIDELPQLLNVLRGQMSLVGPRPERPHFATPLSQTVPDYDDRHRVLGGITGAAQVNDLWGNSSVEERIRLDNRYADDWSPWRDGIILLRTLGAAIRKSRAARRTGSEAVVVEPLPDPEPDVELDLDLRDSPGAPVAASAVPTWHPSTGHGPGA
jgi:exopolysaccharide biosynthesis polyprenyl glycosylphosphotransferase